MHTGYDQTLFHVRNFSEFMKQFFYFVARWLVRITLPISLALPAAFAAKPAFEPLFRSDTPAHSGRVLQLAASADEQWIVTGGFDHTLRLWSSVDGRQVQRWVLPREDDRVHAIALSPNGDWLALGGDISAADGSGAVLIMSLRNGRIVNEIRGFNASIGALAFSADGSELAIGFKGQREISSARVDNLADAISGALAGRNAIETGLVIYRTADWQAIFSDGLTPGNVLDIAYGPNDKLLIATDEAPGLGMLALYRRYQGKYSLLKQINVNRRHGSRASWSPDGREIFLGADGRFGADALADLTSGQIAPDDESFRLTRISRNGELLAFSGARQAARGKLQIFASASLASSARTISLPDPLVNDALMLSNGRIAYVSDSGSLTMLTPAGQVQWRNTANTIALANKPQLLKVSADGEWVSLPYETDKGQQETAFHLDTGRFSPVASIDRWHEPLTSRRGLTLQAWEYTTNASANGNRFPFRSRGERSLSVAAHSEDHSFYFGSDHGRLYKATPFIRASAISQSLMMWVRHLGADVVAINLIESRGLLVAVTADGLLRVVRARDGAVLLTYVVHPAERKWLAVSETGHYQASVGGEELGGWVVPRQDGYLSEFFPMSRFRDSYLLPDMVKQVLAKADGAAGVQAAIAMLPNQLATVSAPPPAPAPAANPAKSVQLESAKIAPPALEKLPPSIDVLSPAIETSVADTKLTIRLRVNTPQGAPLTGLSSRVISSGQSTRGVHSGTGASEQTLTVSIPPEDSEIRIVAENRWGSSVPRIIRVRYQGNKQDKPRNLGILRIVAIGVSDYDNPKIRLDLAAKDARDFSQLFATQGGKLYEKVDITVLTDRAADRRSIEGALENLRKRVKPEDTTFVFLSGHGVNDSRQNYYYLPREVDLERLADTAISFQRIRKTLADLPGRNLLFVDTCHAGNVLGNLKAGLSRNNTTAINQMASPENNIIVFASSSGEQESIEKLDWGNGAFTKALIEGLRGEADFKRRGRVTYKQLDAYVSDRVYELTGGQQTPVTPVLVTVPDFPLTVVVQ